MTRHAKKPTRGQSVRPVTHAPATGAAVDEPDTLASLRATLRSLERIEAAAEAGEIEPLGVREATSIARAKRELSTGIRAEIDAQESRARSLPPEEQAAVLVEAVLGLPIAQQVEVLRALRIEASPQVIAEGMAAGEADALQ